MIELLFGSLMIVAASGLIIIPSIHFSKKYAFPKRRIIDDTPEKADLSFNSVKFSDGMGEIKAWYIPAKDSDKIIIIVPGFGANKSVLLDLAPPLHKEGFDLLMIDLRGQGESDSGPCTFGVEESRTILASIDWIKNNILTQRKRISIIGFSIGATAALIAATHSDKIDTIISEGAIYDLNSVIKKGMKQAIGILGLIYYPIVRMLYRHYTGISPKYVNLIDNSQDFRAKKIMIISDSLDKISDIESAKMFYKKIKGGRMLWEVEGAQHSQAFYKNQEEFIQRVVKYIREVPNNN